MPRHNPMTFRTASAEHLSSAFGLLVRGVEPLDDPVARTGAEEDEHEHAEECPGRSAEVGFDRR